MRSYLVSWEIDVDADSPREAAEYVQQEFFCGTSGTNGMANVFTVKEGDGTTTEVDLSE